MSNIIIQENIAIFVGIVNLLFPQLLLGARPTVNLLLRAKARLVQNGRKGSPCEKHGAEKEEEWLRR